MICGLKKTNAFFRRLQRLAFSVANVHSLAAKKNMTGWILSKGLPILILILIITLCQHKHTDIWLNVY